MDLSIFAKYSIKVIHNSSYITYKISDEYYFSDSHNEYEKIVDGWELMQWLSKDLVGRYTIRVSINESETDKDASEIFIENFNPSNGESADTLYIIKPILEETIELTSVEEEPVGYGEEDY